MVGFSDILGGLLGPVKDIIGEVVVNPNDKIKVNLALAQLEDQAQARLDAMTSGQIEVDKVEAASGSVFVAGWRPFVGWVSGTGLAYAIIVQPFLTWFAVLFGFKGVFPTLDTGVLMTALGGMLGIGSMRTVEKIKGVASNNISSPTVFVPQKGGPSTQAGADAPSPQVVPKKKGHFHIF